MVDLDPQLTQFNERLAGARLLHAAPEAVFDAFKAAAGKGGYFCGADIEAALFSRNDPQINLALAAYGDNSTVVRALYKVSAPKPGSTVDERLHDGSIKAALLALNDPHINDLLAAHGDDPIMLHSIYTGSPLELQNATVADQYNTELHHACLGNRRASRCYSGHAALLGTDVFPSLFAVGAIGEAGILIANPTVGDEVLADLFNHAGVFEGINDDRWRNLVGWASDNPRLAEEARDDPAGPDLGACGIQEGIEHLLNMAPATDYWAGTLEGVLDATAPSLRPYSLETHDFFARWLTATTDKGSDGIKDSEESDHYWSLSACQRLCCRVAAVFGAPQVEITSTGSASDDWSARLSRCAHYGKDHLSKEDLDSGYANDHEAFLIAVLCNDAVLLDNDLRRHLESEHQLLPEGDRSKYNYSYLSMCATYGRRCRQLQRTHPWVRANVPGRAEEKIESHDMELHELATAVIEPLKALTNGLESLKWWVASCLIAVVLILLWRG